VPAPRHPPTRRPPARTATCRRRAAAASMPSLWLYGKQWHLATDALPLLGWFILVPAAAFLVAYIVLLAILHAPPSPTCPSSHTAVRESVMWGTLGFAVLHVAVAAAMIAVGLQGKSARAGRRASRPASKGQLPPQCLPPVPSCCRAACRHAL
jgi:hypothetical protein